MVNLETLYLCITISIGSPTFQTKQPSLTAKWLQLNVTHTPNTVAHTDTWDIPLPHSASPPAFSSPVSAPSLLTVVLWTDEPFTALARRNISRTHKNKWVTVSVKPSGLQSWIVVELEYSRWEETTGQK